MSAVHECEHKDRADRFARRLAESAATSTQALSEVAGEIQVLRDRLAAVKVLIDEPGVRHLQPPNWRDRVLSALEPSS